MELFVGVLVILAVLVGLHLLGELASHRGWLVAAAVIGLVVSVLYAMSQQALEDSVPRPSPFTYGRP